MTGVGRADDSHPIRPAASIETQLAAERQAGLDRIGTYGRVEQAVSATRADLARLIDADASGGRVAAYRAPSRDNTLLNACEIGPDGVEFTVDRSTWKQGRYLPGSHLPIHPPRALREGITPALILTWDIADKIADQVAADPGAALRVAVPFPEARVLEPRRQGVESPRG